MKNLLKIVVAAFLFITTSLVFADVLSPVGTWKTIDDVSGKPKSIIQVSVSSGRLYGRVARIYPGPGQDQNLLCTACKGSKHNQRIVGMTILENLKQNPKDPNEWVDGKILDPKTGKIYRCNLKVVAGGQRMTVRGYIGVSLFGRTQTWIRQ